MSTITTNLIIWRCFIFSSTSGTYFFTFISFAFIFLSRFRLNFLTLS
nr:MAG TPA: hypothetical protein [Crassvirales sp.]